MFAVLAQAAGYGDQLLAQAADKITWAAWLICQIGLGIIHFVFWYGSKEYAYEWGYCHRINNALELQQRQKLGGAWSKGYLMLYIASAIFMLYAAHKFTHEDSVYTSITVATAQFVLMKVLECGANRKMKRWRSIHGVE